jgi:hypothetical protein
MADIWLPGWTRHQFNLRGKPYQYAHNPKGCLHTTEGGSIAGALGAYAPYPPHGIYDWRSREKLQHIPLNLASYSAMDGNDDDYMAQIELVGFAADTRSWPEQAWRNIAEDVVKPLEDHFGIPRRAVWHGFKDGQDGIYPYISSASSPIRLSAAQLRDFSGWLGHQHLPAPDNHWDPGAIRMDRIFTHLEDDVSLTENQDKWLLATYKKLVESDSVVNAINSVGTRLGSRIDAIAARVGELETSGIPVTVDYERLAVAVADVLDKRARDNDPTTGPTS